MASWTTSWTDSWADVCEFDDEYYKVDKVEKVNYCWHSFRRGGCPKQKIGKCVFPHGGKLEDVASSHNLRVCANENPCKHTIEAKSSNAFCATCLRDEHEDKVKQAKARFPDLSLLCRNEFGRGCKFGANCRYVHIGNFELAKLLRNTWTACPSCNQCFGSVKNGQCEACIALYTENAVSTINKEQKEIDEAVNKGLACLNCSEWLDPVVSAFPTFNKQRMCAVCKQDVDERKLEEQKAAKAEKRKKKQLEKQKKKEEKEAFERLPVTLCATKGCQNGTKLKFCPTCHEKRQQKKLEKLEQKLQCE